jgi:hypothetical protein
MSDPGKKKMSLKQKIFHEMAEYWINVGYLALVFAAFTQYRRFVLAAHDITYTNYWVAVIEALVLAKVVMIGDALRLGRRLDQHPLIYSTLLKTVVFSLFVGAFTLIEHVIKGLVMGKGLTGGLVDLLGKGHHALLGGCLVIFVAFIPFFAFRELGRLLGEGKIWTFFFRRRDDPGAAQEVDRRGEQPDQRELQESL